MTVEELFSLIEDMTGADGFSVGYDNTYGYPTNGSFDPSRNSTDDEWGFTVRSFVPSSWQPTLTSAARSVSGLRR
jgi:hypothetical protein